MTPENQLNSEPSAGPAMGSDLPGVAAPGADISPSVPDAIPPGQQSETIEEPPPIEPVKRGRGRPRKDEAIQRLNSVNPAPPKPAPIERPVTSVNPMVNYDQLGMIAANLWFNVGHLTLGDDWVPDDSEVPLVKNAFRDYFQAAGITSISPGLQLGLVLGSYTLSRVQKPTIKSRIFGAFEWLKNKIKR